MAYYSTDPYPAGKPLARFRAAVNKSIETRRQNLAKFRAAVKRSMAAPIKKRSSKQSMRNRRKPSLSRQLSHRSSQLSFTLGATGAFSSQNVVIEEEEEKGEEEEEEEVNNITEIWTIQILGMVLQLDALLHSFISSLSE